MNDAATTQWDPGIPLPPFDPMGLPAPPLLILALTYVMFTLHLLAVNFTLGSIGMALWTRRDPDPARQDIARFFGAAAPLGFSYLVTFGIPPLLFVQLLYGQFFYSSSVLIGAFWIAVIPLLILAYAALYLHKLTREGRPHPQGLILAVALGGMLAVGFIYVNNLTLAMTPGRWLAMVVAHPEGAALNLAEPTLFPRFVMFLGLSPAAAGVALLMRGGSLRGRGREEAASSSRLGLRATLLGAVLWVLGLAAWLFALPESPRGVIVGGGVWTGVFAAAIILVGVAVLLAWPASRATGLALPFAAAASLAVGFACLLVVRDQVRVDYLRDFFALDSVPVHPQWGMFAIFAATLLGGVAFTGVLLVRAAGRSSAQ